MTDIHEIAKYAVFLKKSKTKQNKNKNKKHRVKICQNMTFLIELH